MGLTEDQKREGIHYIVKEIIQDIAPDEDGIEGLDPSKRLRDQMDLDSMDFLDIVLELRKRYSVEVPEEDYLKLATLDSSAEYLGDKISEEDISTAIQSYQK